VNANSRVVLLGVVGWLVGNQVKVPQRVAGGPQSCSHGLMETWCHPSCPGRRPMRALGERTRDLPSSFNTMPRFRCTSV
jgi:hypothetical protein